MSELSVSLGARIKTLRKLQSFTQEKLAEMAELNATYIGQIERGEKSPTLDTLGKISNAFDISVSELLTFDSVVQEAEEKEMTLSELLLEYSEKIKVLYEK